MTKSEQAIVVREVLMALADAIKEGSKGSLGGVPSGHLYAVLMGQMSLEVYNKYIGCLISAGLVTQKNHLLSWKGK